MSAQFAYLPPDALDTHSALLWKIAIATGVSSGLIAASSVSGGATYSTTTTGVSASASGSIPAAATSWTFQLLTGTGTFDGVSIPTGLAITGQGPGSADIPYTTDGGSSAIVSYQTAA